MDGKQVARELVKVAKELMAGQHREANVLSAVADNFVRFCVGDRKAALGLLKTLSMKNFEGNVAGLSPEEQNALYADLHKGFLMVLKRYLPV